MQVGGLTQRIALATPVSGPDPRGWHCRGCWRWWLSGLGCRSEGRCGGRTCFGVSARRPAAFAGQVGGRLQFEPVATCLLQRPACAIPARWYPFTLEWLPWKPAASSIWSGSCLMRSSGCVCAVGSARHQQPRAAQGAHHRGSGCLGTRCATSSAALAAACGAFLAVSPTILQ